MTDLELREILLETYEYRDGDKGWGLYWKNCSQSKKKNGIKAGYIKNNSMHGSKDYWYVAVNRRNYREHRMIFLMHHGYLPQLVDHNDNNSLNNDINNLRVGTKNQNGYNQKLSKRNTSGYKNVFRSNNKKNPFCVRMRVDTKALYFGNYATAEEANEVAIRERERLHGQFANHG